MKLMLVKFMRNSNEFMGIIKNKVSRKFSGIMLSCLIGHSIIYILGICWLSTFIGLYGGTTALNGWDTVASYKNVKGTDWQQKIMGRKALQQS